MLMLSKQSQINFIHVHIINILRKFVFYSPTGCELKAHERDIWTPEPINLKPPAPRDKVSMDDVTDFPE